MVIWIALAIILFPSNIDPAMCDLLTLLDANSTLPESNETCLMSILYQAVENCYLNFSDAFETWARLSSFMNKSYIDSEMKKQEWNTGCYEMEKEMLKCCRNLTNCEVMNTLIFQDMWENLLNFTISYRQMLDRHNISTPKSQIQIFGVLFERQ